jgi:hypothetical protein
MPNGLQTESCRQLKANHSPTLHVIVNPKPGRFAPRPDRLPPAEAVNQSGQ